MMCWLEAATGSCPGHHCLHSISSGIRSATLKTGAFESHLAQCKSVEEHQSVKPTNLQSASGILPFMHLQVYLLYSPSQPHRDDQAGSAAVLLTGSLWIWRTCLNQWQSSYGTWYRPFSWFYPALSSYDDTDSWLGSATWNSGPGSVTWIRDLDQWVNRSCRPSYHGPGLTTSQVWGIAVRDKGLVSCHVPPVRATGNDSSEFNIHSPVLTVPPPNCDWSSQLPPWSNK